ncbi:MAG: sulfatase [Sedimentisphaerales bacterium]|nr:sulfatase [Sedimentisphaerales bacterium]
MNGELKKCRDDTQWKSPTNLSRREFVKLLGMMGAYSMLGKNALFAEQATQKPNVLFIAVDDLRPQLGCYGQNYMITPNIDRLAKNGVVFNRAYCQVPVCGASRASLLTGLRPKPDRFINYDSYAGKDAPGITDLPMYFKQNGYRTVSNGKIYHHKEDNQASWDEIYRPSDFRQYQTKENLESMKKFKKAAAYESPDVADNVLQGGKIADKVILDLRQAKKSGRPVFITAGPTKPHLPFIAPKKYWDMYKREDIDLADNPFAPKNSPKQALHNWGELRDMYTGIPKTGPVSDELARTLIHGYYACTTYTDAIIGNILDELDKLNMRENTLVVLWGDHGWQLGEHGLWCKHANFNTSLQAPLIFSAPGVSCNTKCDALVEFIDIYPTLCELAGLPLPSHLQGASLVPQLKNPQTPGKNAVFSRYLKGDSIRTDRHLYTEWSNKGKVQARMLYDHHADPAENINISEMPENRELVAKLSRMLQSHCASVQ